MKSYKTVSILAMVTLLSACGGSGGDEASSPQTQEVNVLPPTPLSTATSPKGTSTLLVDSDYTLATYRNIEIDVDVSERMTGSLFLNVCEHELGDTEVLDYQSCLLSTPLLNGSTQARLALSNKINSLGAEIINIQDLESVYTVHWDQDELRRVDSLTIN